MKTIILLITLLFSVNSFAQAVNESEWAYDENTDWSTFKDPSPVQIVPGSPPDLGLVTTTPGPDAEVFNAAGKEPDYAVSPTESVEEKEALEAEGWKITDLFFD